MKNFLYQLFFSTHPRTRIKLENIKYKFPKNFISLKPFGFFDYVKLEKNAKCVLSDSGSITEEASILNFNALNIREMHERPEGFEECSVMFTGLNVNRIRDCLRILEEDSHNKEHKINIVKDYDIDNFSKKVVRIIHSYVDYIKNNVWKDNISD